MDSVVNYESYYQDVISYCQYIAVAQYITIGLIIGFITFFMIKR